MTDRRADSTSPVPTLVSSLLMLYVGFGLSWVIASDSSLYALSASVFLWTMKIGGLAMLLSAGLYFARLRIAIVFETLTAGACGLVMLATGAIWVINGDMTGLLLLIFAMMFLHSAWENWPVLRSPRADVEAMLDADLAAAHRGDTPQIENEYKPRTPKLPRRADLQKGMSPSVAQEPPVSTPPPAKSPPPAPPAEEDELAGGFLADLGRSDDDDENQR